MVGTTRSGRVTKPTAKAKPQGPVAVQEGRNRYPPRGSSGKGRRGGQRIPPSSHPSTSRRPLHRPHQREESTTADPSIQSPAEAHAVAPPPLRSRQVDRVFNAEQAVTAHSIYFAPRAGLENDQATKTIALNLIDYFIFPSNWNPELWYNILAATCFYFASKLTGKNTTAEQIANSIEVDHQVVIEYAVKSVGPEARYDSLLLQGLAKDMEVSTENVRRGYEILYEQKEKLRELVGEYAGNIDTLPSPEEQEAAVTPGFRIKGQQQQRMALQNLDVQEGSTITPVEEIKDTDKLEEAEKIEEPETLEEIVDIEPTQLSIPQDVTPPVLLAGGEDKASEVDLDCDELDEFDTFVAENE